jgi:hypothetical protein
MAQTAQSMPILEYPPCRDEENTDVPGIRRLVEAGCDEVLIHGAHGNLVSG